MFGNHLAVWRPTPLKGILKKAKGQNEKKKKYTGQFEEKQKRPSIIFFGL
jgi:hypothetical protein